MIVLAPIAWPTAKLLDWLLGEDHGTTYKKAELKTFVSLHQQLGTENLNEDEVTIIRAVLDLNDKTVKDVMTPIQDVFIMSADTILDEEGVGKLVQSGYSRVPVHEKGKPDSIIGMLLVKDLISYDPEDGHEVASFQLRPLPETAPDLSLLSTLNYFQTGRSHMLLVSQHPGEPKGAMGIVTLEDVVEELIGEEIIDETDVWVDVHNRVRVTRNPKESGGAGAGSVGGADLGPLVRGIIERRRLGGLKPKAGSQAPLQKAVANNVRAIDRVMIKQTDSPSRSSYDGGSAFSPDRHAQYAGRRSSSAHTPRPLPNLIDSADTESSNAILVDGEQKSEAQARLARQNRSNIQNSSARRRTMDDESQPLLGNGIANRR
jgi:metal transporter CNNM